MAAYPVSLGDQTKSLFDSDFRKSASNIFNTWKILSFMR